MFKILNLYAGIGGNRKLWDDVEVTAVEHDPNIAKIYQDFFPSDKIIVGDAHQYLLEHYKKFDFIWISPPCPTHSDIRRVGVHSGKCKAVYFDSTLWQEIILLQHFGRGKWVVENVRPYYEPLVAPTFKLDRHYFWANFKINYIPKFTKREIVHDRITDNSTIFEVNLVRYNIKNKRKILRNMVNPEIGLLIFEQAMKIQNKKFKNEQLNIFDICEYNV